MLPFSFSDPAFSYWALRLARALLWACDLVSSALTGQSIQHGSTKESIDASSHGRTAQVASIIARAQYIPVMPFHGLHNFLCCHEEFVDPKIVLRKRNICLFFVEEEVAVFCVAKEGTDLYDTKVFPFLYMSLYASAEKLLILPIDEFHKLAEEAGDPQIPVSVAGMTARCGSTLLSQMMNRVPGTRSISEPMATVNVYQLWHAGKISQSESDRLLRSCLRLLFKVEPGSGVDRVFAKLTQFNNVQVPEITRMFPQFKVAFNTRLPAPSVKSFTKIFATMEGTLFYKLGLNWHFFHRFPFPRGDRCDAVMAEVDPRRQNMDDEQVSLLLYASGLAAYLEHKDLYDRVFLYENLVADPRGETKALFKLASAPEEYLDDALEAIGINSQGTLFAPARESSGGGGGGSSRDRISDLFRGRLGIDLGADTRLEDFERLLKP